MTKNILLLGAGFSRNWGGWTSDAVRSDVAMRLEAHAYLSNLLNNSANFEDALARVQADYLITKNEHTRDRLQTLQSAIGATFNLMNVAMAQRQFEFHNTTDCSVALYLTKFDAIFTLNQDLLLERHYLHPFTNILTRSGGKVQGGLVPGMAEITDANNFGDDRALRARWRPMVSPFSMVPLGYQPYIKLHGSTNWLSHDGEQLMVMGGEKSATIQRHPILKWYTERFLECLSRPGARLTVIGYGFRDGHINLILEQAWQKSRFPMMIVDPSGREILRKINPSYSGAIYARGPLEEIITYVPPRILPTHLVAMSGRSWTSCIGS